MKKIIVTGATGFIGRKIVLRLIERGDQVTVFSRSTDNAKRSVPGAEGYIKWNLRERDWYSALEGKDAVIHLAGENIMGKRWSSQHKHDITASRTDGTTSIITAINSISKKPKLFISASAVGFYGNTEEAVDENSEAGNDFLAEVVKAWENSSNELDPGVRKAIIRIGMVLDKNDGALAKMIPAFKYFIGGPLGSGNQWFPWIHINDVVGIFLFAIDNENVTGVLNATSPSPVRMKEFSRTIGKVIHRPSLLKVPAFVLKLILGEASEAILGGAQVFPKKTIEAGYKYSFCSVKDALENILL
jgi:hypothetical protein